MAKKQTRGKTVTPDVIDVGPENPDQALIQTEASAARSFLTSLMPFFLKARECEDNARAALVEAKSLQPPTNGDEDLAIQNTIRRFNGGKRDTEAHWEPPTSAFWHLHRKLTAARGRALKAWDDAAAVAQRLHNQYDEAERARVRRENDRARIAAEDQARLDREAELERLEGEALKVEASSPELSERERIFVDLYVDGPAPVQGQGDKCAERAGFKDAFKAAARLLASEKIIAAINVKRQAVELRKQAAAQAAMPLNVVTDDIKPDIQRGCGYDRSSHGADILDARMFVEAVVGGKHGIPIDALMPDPAKLNEYARALHELIDKWPGIRYKKSTRTI